MAQPSVTHGSFVIERHFSTTPECLFAAFADPEKKRRWFAKATGPGSFEMDFRVGGTERTRGLIEGDSPYQGTSIANDTTYQDIVPGRRIVLAYTMTLGGRRISASLATFDMVSAGDGTRLIFTEQGAYFEGADGPAMRQEGWGKLLDRLAAELFAELAHA